MMIDNDSFIHSTIESYCLLDAIPTDLPTLFRFVSFRSSKPQGQPNVDIGLVRDSRRELQGGVQSSPVQSDLEFAQDGGQQHECFHLSQIPAGADPNTGSKGTESHLVGGFDDPHGRVRDPCFCWCARVCVCVRW
mmetsp:Transcript_18015/g.39300  ORF Transcript_18015/g.39300 Transcript_18015/m.39300 type:complete len:135 (+) Transcript_18015:11-415(+)